MICVGGFGFGGGCVLAGLLFGGVGFSISCDSGLWGVPVI